MTLTLNLLVRGLKSEDGDVLRQALAYVSTKDDATKTAVALLKSDPKAREQFPEERQLVGYLRGLGAAAVRGGR